jgi:heptose I phosphotransferase
MRSIIGSVGGRRIGMKAEVFDQGRITVASDFAALLKENGLDTFEKVMRVSGGKIFRDFPGRRTVRLELKMANGLAQHVFLKRYESNYLGFGGRLLRLLRWPGASDEALREWRMLHHLRLLGISTATPVAIGQQEPGAFATRSFVATAEIPNAIEANVWVEKLPASRRTDFLLRVAEMARRFHAAGLVHKDYYLSHVLVGGNSAAPELFLIDLQRVIRPRCWRRRWVVKDLGALAYSTWNAGVSRTEILRAYLAYCGQKRLEPATRRIARQALRRVTWLRTRQPRHGAPVCQRA